MYLGIREYLRLASGLPLSEVWRRACGLLLRFAAALASKCSAYVTPTTVPDDEIPVGELLNLLEDLEPGDLDPWRSEIESLANATLEHRFDLLGSGPVRIFYGLTAQGIGGRRYGPTPSPNLRVNRANRAYSKRLSKKISLHYQPIDWHIDFKSGFRWSVATWYSDIAYGELPGVDVKVPWELARCQHLPWLAWGYAATPVQDRDRRARLIQEFKDQIRDFCVANPPQFGVNWACTMDVGIRAANWVMAHALFRAGGVHFDADFDGDFKRTLMEHGRHIVNNLEWSSDLRSNHYLANVCGLLYVAAYLPACSETTAWLMFARHEVLSELELQFLPDGANFEASTSYHRLSGEMALYSVALLLRLIEQPVSRSSSIGLEGLRFSGPGPDPRSIIGIGKKDLTEALDWVKLSCMVSGIVRFTRSLTRPDGLIAQFGDNDSGRFFKLWPTLSKRSAHLFSEEVGCHRHLDIVASGLFGSGASDESPEYLVIEALTKKHKLCAVDNERSRVSIGLARFPDFGAYVYGTSGLWAAVRCGSVGQRGNGGHTHNDQLSFELALCGVTFLVDPGTYLYTPFPESRNHFRSTSVHNTPSTKQEQNSWLEGRLGLFNLTHAAKTRVLECDARRFIGEHDGFGKICRREIHFGETSVQVIDYFLGDFKLTLQFAPETKLVLLNSKSALVIRHGVHVHFSFDAGVLSVLAGQVSPAYGVIENAPCLRVAEITNTVTWQATVIKAGSL